MKSTTSTEVSIEAPGEGDPFAGIVDEQPADGTSARSDLLDTTRRGYVPIRKTFVQKPRGSETRASVLARLVTQRQHRELKLYLLYLALRPVLREPPLPLAVWARMLHAPRGLSASTEQVSKAFTALHNHQLLARSAPGAAVRLTALREDGSGHPYTRPGSPEDTDAGGPGYFTVPHEFWHSGLADQLTLPGTAMFLIILAETTQKTSFQMSVERAPDYYGISERTAERGYKQLEESGVLLTHSQGVRDPRSTTGYRRVVHRALEAPYSTAARHDRQAATRKAVSARGEQS